ncbi:hypothetical protein C0J52_24744 [Blattella germanica]|nr:hypothetical protein C0J52_24744 [Blattella germanica]
MVDIGYWHYDPRLVDSYYSSSTTLEINARYYCLLNLLANTSQPAAPFFCPAFNRESYQQQLHCQEINRVRLGLFAAWPVLCWEALKYRAQ